MDEFHSKVGFWLITLNIYNKKSSHFLDFGIIMAKEIPRNILKKSHIGCWFFFEIWKSKNQTNLWITCFHVKAGKKWQLLMLHMDIWFSRSFAWEWIKHTLNRFHKQSLFQTKFTTDHWIQYDWHLSMGFYSLVMIVIFLDV